jgi:hypothetical protein
MRIATLSPASAQVIQVLAQHKSEITFPVDEFKYCAAHALISMEQGDLRAAELEDDFTGLWPTPKHGDSKVS